VLNLRTEWILSRLMAKMPAVKTPTKKVRPQIRLLKGPDAPTALVLGSIQLTLGVLEELSEQRVKVPAELSVVGFGDEPGFSWWGPGLTTIGLPIQEMATGCALWLMRRLKTAPSDDGPYTSVSGPYTSVSPGSLILRGSTAPPPGRALPGSR
jgi:DNA-binding LacI/PurR family transcriptional regulator